MLTHEIARRLEQKLGLGEFPMVRRRLFSRLQRVCEQSGDVALLVVAAVLEESCGPKIRDKGKYFSFTCVRRLTEAGFWQQADSVPNQTREQVHHLADAKASIGQPVPDPDKPSQASELERLRLSNEMLKRDLDALRRPPKAGAL